MDWNPWKKLRKERQQFSDLLHKKHILIQTLKLEVVSEIDKRDKLKAHVKNQNEKIERMQKRIDRLEAALRERDGMHGDIAFNEHGGVIYK